MLGFSRTPYIRNLPLSTASGRCVASRKVAGTFVLGSCFILALYIQQPSMKYIPTLLIGLLLFPSLAFADTSHDDTLRSLIASLLKQVAALQAELASLQETQHPAASGSPEPDIQVKMENRSAIYFRDYSYTAKIPGTATYNLSFSISSIDKIYIPLSLGTSTGIAYLASGSVQSYVPSTGVQCTGDGVTTVFTDTRYCVIPADGSARFDSYINISGSAGDSYGITVGRIFYKMDPFSSTLYSVPVSGVRTGDYTFGT